MSSPSTRGQFVNNLYDKPFMPGALLAWAFSTNSRTSFTLRLDMSKATPGEAGFGMPDICGRGTSEEHRSWFFSSDHPVPPGDTSRTPLWFSMNSDLAKA